MNRLVIVVVAVSSSVWAGPAVYAWEDSDGPHYTDDAARAPRGQHLQAVVLPPRELNGLLPPPQEARGPFTKRQWREQFEALRARRQHLARAGVSTHRQCHDAPVEVVVPPASVTWQQVVVADCAGCKGHLALARPVANRPQRVSTSVRLCSDVPDLVAERRHAQSVSALEADERALAEQAQRFRVPAAWQRD